MVYLALWHNLDDNMEQRSAWNPPVLWDCRTKTRPHCGCLRFAVDLNVLVCRRKNCDTSPAVLVQEDLARSPMESGHRNLSQSIKNIISKELGGFFSCPFPHRHRKVHPMELGIQGPA